MLKFIAAIALAINLDAGWAIAAGDSAQSTTAETTTTTSGLIEPVEPVEQPVKRAGNTAELDRMMLEQLQGAWQSGGQSAAWKLIDLMQPGDQHRLRFLLMTRLKEMNSGQTGDNPEAQREILEVSIKRIEEDRDILREANRLKQETKVPFGHAVDAFPTEGTWPIYDVTAYAGKPDLMKHGMKPLELVGSRRLFGTGRPDQPEEQQIRKVARELPTDRPVCLDVEHWSTEPQHIGATIDKMIRICRWIRDVNPDVRFGFYATVPQRRYWEPVLRELLRDSDRKISERHAAKYLKRYEQWQQANQQLRRLADEVDFIFPSLYTFYDDVAGWQVYARENIAAARQYGKPVIPFLWPAYHPSNAKMAHQPIGPDYWRVQLQTVRPLADGVVIWMGTAGRLNWEEWRWWYDVMQEEWSMPAAPPAASQP